MNSISIGMKTMQAVMKASMAARANYVKKFHIKEPDALGEKIIDNTDKLKEKIGGFKGDTVFGFHGTRLSEKIKKQLDNGLFDQKGLRVYFEPKANGTVALYASNVPGMDDKDKGVILHIASDYPAQLDEVQNKYYFPEESKVHILAAYELREDYDVEIEDKKMLKKLNYFANEFIHAYNHEMGELMKGAGKQPEGKGTQELPREDL
jgi:hypothetical protein